MNEDNELEFKDKEIEEITSALAKEKKRLEGNSVESGSTSADSPVETGQAVTGSTEIEKNDAVIKPLQTYERDIAEAIRFNNESVTSINLAKQKRQQESETTTEKTEKIARKGLTLLISLVLVVAGVSVAVLIYYFASNRPPAVVPVIPSLITTNEKRTIDIAGLSVNGAPDKILEAMENPGKETDLIQIELTEGPAENKQAISAQRFFELFAIGAPPTLGRAFGDQWVFGFQSVNGASAPFIFVSIDSFDNAFDGMLRWENTATENLGQIFLKPETKIAGKTTDGSGFEDLIIRSKDTRVLKDNLGNIVLLYSFLDLKNLVITTNERTFQELLNRFFSSRVVR
ncbi:MAG: hypothetical protein AAB635_02130 [Patescibacteria group bacterium]